MKLSQQVITLEQGKRLKELGVNTHSIFYWQDRHNNYLNNGQPNNVDARVVSHHYFNGDSDKAMFFPAYTVAELGVMLHNLVPQKVGCQVTPYLEYYSHTGKDMWKYDKTYTAYARDVLVTTSDTEAQARGEMLIHYIETGIITAEQCNASLTP